MVDPASMALSQSSTTERICHKVDRFGRKPYCSSGITPILMQCSCSCSRTKPSNTFSLNDRGNMTTSGLMHSVGRSCFNRDPVRIKIKMATGAMIVAPHWPHPLPVQKQWWSLPKSLMAKIFLDDKLARGVRHGARQGQHVHVLERVAVQCAWVPQMSRAWKRSVRSIVSARPRRSWATLGGTACTSVQRPWLWQ